MMKKYLIMLIMAVAVFVSCGQDNLLPGDETVQLPPITFNLTANPPDATKAVKTGWEAGDAIFVFFNKVAAPKFLKMTYNGTGWTCAEMNGGLGLKNGDSGMMRAVFLPFGSDATVSAEGGSFVFSTTYYAYYLTATMSYTVTDNKVSGAFDMSIPKGYVQFFIEDGGATNGAYTLGTDAVIPVGVASIAADGAITETSDTVAGNDMTGYVYDNGIDPKGYLFSGKLNDEYHSYQRSGGEIVDAHAYYFAKTKTADNTRADYFVSGKTIASHSAIKLPANDNVYEVNIYGSANTGKWVPVGRGISVSLCNVSGSGELEQQFPLGGWYTCNYGQAVPESLGSLYTFDDANALGVTLPTKAQSETINNNCSYTGLTVHGQRGTVVKADRGFLFLPALDVETGYYWTSTITDYNSDLAWHIWFKISGLKDTLSNRRTFKFAVRPIQN